MMTTYLHLLILQFCHWKLTLQFTCTQNMKTLLCFRKRNLMSGTSRIQHKTAPRQAANTNLHENGAQKFTLGKNM